MGTNMSLPETWSGTTTVWAPLTTTFTFPPACTDYVRWNSQSFVAFDPGYGKIEAGAQDCLPPAVSSWWASSRVPGNTQQVSIGPVVCPQSYKTLKSSVNDQSSTRILCCPPGYTLAEPTNSGFDVGCESDATAGMILTYAFTSASSTDWHTSITTLSTKTAISAVPIPGWIYPGFQASPNTATTTKSSTVVAPTALPAAAQIGSSSSSSTSSATSTKALQGNAVVTTSRDDTSVSTTASSSTSSSKSTTTVASSTTSRAGSESTSTTSTSDLPTSTNSPSNTTSSNDSSTKTSLQNLTVAVVSSTSPGSTTTSVSISSSSPDDTKAKPSSQIRLYIGIGSSCGAAVLLLVILGLWLWCRRKRRNTPEGRLRISASSMSPETHLAVRPASGGMSNVSRSEGYSSEPREPEMTYSRYVQDAERPYGDAGYHHTAPMNPESRGSPFQQANFDANPPRSSVRLFEDAATSRSVASELYTENRRSASPWQPRVPRPLSFAQSHKDRRNLSPGLGQPSPTMTQLSPGLLPPIAYASELPENHDFVLAGAHQDRPNNDSGHNELHELPVEGTEGGATTQEVADTERNPAIRSSNASSLLPQSTVYTPSPARGISTQSVRRPSGPSQDAWSSYSPDPRSSAGWKSRFDFLKQDPMGPEMPKPSVDRGKARQTGSSVGATWSSSDPDLETDDSTISGWPDMNAPGKTPTSVRNPTWSFRGVRNGTSVWARKMSKMSTSTSGWM